MIPSPDLLHNRQTLIRRAIGTLLIALVAVIYTVVYRPAARRLETLHSQIATQFSELNQIRSRTRNLPALQSEVDQLAARIQPLQPAFATRADLPAFIKEIGTIGQQSAVRKFECQPGTMTKLDHLMEQKVVLTFEGDFFNVFQFLQQSEQLPRLKRLRTLSLKTRDPKLGQVEVKMAMNLYFTE